MTAEQAGPIEAVMRYFMLDWPLGRRQSSWWRLGAALVVAVVGSVLACAILAKLGPLVFPSTAGYVHFRFGDYTKLTVIGVVIAWIAWPVATLASSRAARPLFLWAAVVVTVVSFAPDVRILMKGQSAPAVLVLAVMHVAVAAVTYPALVFIAPQRRTEDHPDS